MIDEPIERTEYMDNSFFEACRAKGQRECFYRQSVDYDKSKPLCVIALIDTVNSSYHHYYFRFAIVVGQNNYRFDGDLVSKEEFIAGMIERYPDHFEWLLYHPEYLL